MTQSKQTDSSTFAKRLRLTRQAAGLTQTELAERAGVSTGANISVMEKEGSYRFPRVDNIVAFADALDCSVDYLLGRTTDSTSHLTTRKQNAKYKTMAKDFNKLQLLIDKLKAMLTHE